MAEVETVEPPVVSPEPPPSSGGVQSVDPFALEESQLASLSPEQRASLDPIIDSWKKRATEEIQKRETQVSEKYKPLEDKAKALDQLTQYQPFVQWWQNQQRVAMQGQTPEAKQTIAATQPEDIATAQEWQDAIIDASNGSPQKLRSLQQRLIATTAAPFVQQFSQKSKELETRLEMRDLMESHPDYKDLDQIGLDEKGQGTSLLEHCLNWAEASGKSLEEGYQLAKRWANSMSANAKAQAMGMVQGKKDAVIQGPSTSSASGTVIYVENQDELMKKSMEAALEGRKDVRFEIKKSK